MFHLSFSVCLCDYQTEIVNVVVVIVDLLCSSHGIIVIAKHTQKNKNCLLKLHKSTYLYIFFTLFCCHVWFGVHFTFYCLECHIFALVRDLTHNLNLNIRLCVHKHTVRNMWENEKLLAHTLHIVHRAAAAAAAVASTATLFKRIECTPQIAAFHQLMGKNCKKKIKQFTVSSQTIYFSVNGVFIWLVSCVRCTMYKYIYSSSPPNDSITIVCCVCKTKPTAIQR